jgi:hypothetical protein
MNFARIKIIETKLTQAEFEEIEEARLGKDDSFITRYPDGSFCPAHEFWGSADQIPADEMAVYMKHENAIETRINELTSYHGCTRDELKNALCDGAWLAEHEPEMRQEEVEELYEYLKAAPKIETLDDLFALMKARDPRLPRWDSLPNFGGQEPADTFGVWSWDETRLIAGSCAEDIEIVNRDEYEDQE